MMSRFASMALAMSLALIWSASLFAAEADELRERVQAMRKEAAALAERGHREEAERLARESVELLKLAERHEIEQRPQRDLRDELGRHLQELRKREQRLQKENAPGLAELREQIANAERKADALRAEGERRRAEDGPSAPQHELKQRLEEAGRRSKHLRAAAEHLRQADAPDLAQQLLEKADAIEHEARRAKEQMAPAAERPHDAPHPELPAIAGQMEELRREMHRLRAELNELRARIEPK